MPVFFGRSHFRDFFVLTAFFIDAYVTQKLEGWSEAEVEMLFITVKNANFGTLSRPITPN